ncbi:MAG: 3-dehydroquinate synthase family protein [Planctomycetota bacterium]
MTLETISVDIPGAAYGVTVGMGARSRIADAVDHADGVAQLVDRRVAGLHGTPCSGVPTLELQGGEGIKTLESLGRVLDFCAEAGLSRRSTLVAFGGGTIGDLGGLAASLFKRGLDVVQVPTTLLAQVDASVGGKTAINLAAGKNLAGTFHHPRAVFCDADLLATLDDEDFASGLGEVAKTAILGGDDALSRTEELAKAVVARDADALAEVVAMCVGVKARVVASDPEERGARRALNLGHTFGHAIEHAAGYGRVPHGVAVAVGLALAARATEGAFDADPELTTRTLELLRCFGLPTSLDELRSRDGLREALTPEALHVGLGHDKKGTVGSPEFVLARRPGDIALGVRLDDELLMSLLR